MDRLLQTDEDSKALLDFLTDIKCLEPIKDKAEKFNLFDVFGFARNEIRHSFVLKWLFDPKENHGLGDSFTKAVIAHLVSLEPDRYGDKAFELLMLDCNDFTVQREMNNIDLFLCSEAKSVAIIIENKIGSHEHSSTGFDSQLDKYKTYVEDAYKHIKTKIFVYLTPQNESASDEEIWQSLSYSEIVDIISEIYDDYKERMSQDARTLVQNYIDIVRRDIVEDQELNILCNEIYRKHRKALDLIYSHSDLGMNPTSRIITEVLSGMATDGKVDYNPKDQVVFHTPAMTDFLRKLSEPNSSWSTIYPYNYWFKVEGEKISFVFEIGFWGLDEDTKKKMDGFINTRRPKSKKATERYKRVETFDWVNLEEYEEDEKKKQVTSIVESVLNKELLWIDECKTYISRKTNE